MAASMNLVMVFFQEAVVYFAGMFHFTISYKHTVDVSARKQDQRKEKIKQKLTETENNILYIIYITDCLVIQYHYA